MCVCIHAFVIACVCVCVIVCVCVFSNYGKTEIFRFWKIFQVWEIEYQPM